MSGPSNDPARAAPVILAASVAERARTAPDSPAVVDQHRAMTFAELDALAGGVAAAVLDRAGAVTAGWLPVVVDRSVEATVALHGALRSGHPFTPIESTMPREWIAAVFARLGHPANAVVSRPDHAHLLPAGVRAIPAVGREMPDVTPRPVAPDAPGLVMFTSGSTGRSKGVVREWRALDRTSLGEQRRAATGHVSLRRSHLQPYGFGAGLMRLTAHTVGASLHIADPSGADTDSLLDWLDAQQIDDLSLGPTLAAVLLGVTRGRRRLPTVTSVGTGAEALNWELVPPLRALVAPGATISSVYAATECGVLCRYDIGPDDPVGTGRVPMGPPVDPARLRLDRVDAEGDVTQLAVADPDIIEYLDEPALTAQRVVTDEAGRRWWLSGDVVEVDPSGVYHHRGRLDDMVIVNGMLVSPTQAEEVLRGIPGIGHVAVLVHPTGAGRSRLVAHLRVDDDTLTPDTVRGALERTLPRHLVPSVLVRHPELPRTDRDKLDRRALMAMPVSPWRHGEPLRRDMAEVEWWLVGQVQRILELDDIGPDDDLWHLGLDSLGAVELCAAIADTGQGDLDPTALLEHRTAAALAARLSRGRRDAPADGSTAVVLNPSGQLPPMFAVPGGGGTSLAFVALAQALGPDQPLVVVEPQGMHRPGRPDRSIDACAAHVIAEIDRRLAPSDPCVVLGYSAGATIAYEVAQRLHRSPRPVRLVLLDAAPGPHPGGSERAPTSTRLLAKGRGGLVGVVRNSLRHRWLQQRARLLAVHPGRPRSSVARYRAFQIILSQAVAAYSPAAAGFPVRLVQVNGGWAAERCRALAADLAIHEVGGDHRTMLLPPHVGAVAEAVRLSTFAVTAS